MATVYLGRLNGEVGFGRTVAIKRLHPHLAREPEFVMMFLDEAHLAARIHHPNVVQTLDIVTGDDEIFLVMDYIPGESMGALLRAVNETDSMVPIPIVTSIGIGLLNGLHAAHEAKDEAGAPLGIVHRDVSPQNVLVGTDGVPRLLDFGVARAATRLATTRDGQIKGKVPYMAPEQLSGVVSRQTDIYATSVVIWEALACRRLYRGETEAELFSKVVEARAKPPSQYNPEVPPELDQIVLRGLAKAPHDRWPTAHAMAEALDAVLRPASTMRVSEWVLATAGPSLEKKKALVSIAETAKEPRSDLTPSASGPLPVLEPSKDGLSDPGTSLPTLAPTGLHSASVAGPLTREATRTVAPPRGFRYAGLAVGGALVVAAFVTIGRRSVDSNPGSAGPTPPPMPSSAPAVSASAPPGTPGAREAPPATASAPTDVAPPAPAKSGQNKVGKPATLPGTRRPPGPTQDPSELHDLLDTR